MRILPLGYKEGTTICGRPEPEGAALFFEVDDSTLGEIRSDADYFLKRDLVDRCFSGCGRNAHLYLLINGGDTKEIFKKLRFLLEEYDSVSWWTREHRKFYIRRGAK